MLQEKHLSSQAQLPALKSDEAVTLGPITLTASQITAEFQEDLAHMSELIETLQQGSVLCPVPEAPHATTFSLDGPTRNFWVKLSHLREDPSRIERVHLIGVSRRGSGTKHIDLD
jgi:hypothetical protein